MKRLPLILLGPPLFAALLGMARPAMAATLNAASLSEDGSQVLFDFGASVKATASRDGRKVIIKIRGASAKDGLSLPKPSGALSAIRSGEHAKDLWIVVLLKDAHKVALSNNSSGFSLKLAAGSDATASSPPSAEADPQTDADSDTGDAGDLSAASAGQTARIVDVSLAQADGQSQVVISSDSPASYKSVVSDAGKRISLYFRNSSLTWANKDLGGDPAISSLKARSISVHGESQVVLDINLKEKVNYTIRREQNQVVVSVVQPQESSPAEEGVLPSKPDLYQPTTCKFQDADLVGVLTNLAEDAGFQLRLGATYMALAEKDRLVTFDAVNRPLYEVLVGIVQQVGPTSSSGTPFEVKAEGNLLYIGSPVDLQKLRFGQSTTTKFYVPRHQRKTVLENLVLAAAVAPGDDLAAMTNDPTDPDKIMIAGFQSEVETTLRYLRKWDVEETGEENASDDTKDDSETNSNQLQTQIFHLKYLDPNNTNDTDPFTQAIKGLIPVADTTAVDSTTLPRFSFNWDKQRRTLIVTSTSANLKKVAELITRLDRPLNQVHIEGKIVEVNEDDAKSLGIQWTASQTGGGGGLIEGLTAGQGGAFFANYSSVAALSQINATIDALVTKNRANIISSPSVTTADNQQAMIQGLDTNYIQNATTIVGANGVPTTTFSFTTEPIPLQLQVTPRISAEDNKVYMTVNFNLTTANTVVAVSGQPQNTSAQTIQTQLVETSGDTAVIGGIFKDSYISDETSVPILGDIPLLGLLFKGKTTTKSKDDIIIFLTPTIVPN